MVLTQAPPLPECGSPASLLQPHTPAAQEASEDRLGEHTERPHILLLKEQVGALYVLSMYACMPTVLHLT